MGMECNCWAQPLTAASNNPRSCLGLLATHGQSRVDITLSMEAGRR